MQFSDESNRLFTWGDVGLSTYPIIWEARYKDGSIIRPDLKSCPSWREIAANQLDLVYWGLTWAQGTAGFDLLTNRYVINGVPVAIAPISGDGLSTEAEPFDGALSFRRRMVSGSSTTAVATMFAEIGVGAKRLAVRLLPWHEIILGGVPTSQTGELADLP